MYSVACAHEILHHIKEKKGKRSSTILAYDIIGFIERKFF
jgi:hypothetical protein